MLKGIFTILSFYAAGEAIGALTGGYLPGSVVGMLLLFFALIFRLIKPDAIRSVVQALTENMALFFIPSTVGIMVLYPLILDNLAAIMLSIAVSTIVVLAVVAFIQQKIEHGTD